MTNMRIPSPRAHQRIAVDLEVVVNGVLNHVGGRITDLSEGGARIEGASLPARSRCEIHYGGHVVYAVVMWAEQDRIGVRFPYELRHGPLFRALEQARLSMAMGRAQLFRSNRMASFGRRGLS